MLLNHTLQLAPTLMGVATLTKHHLCFVPVWGICFGVWEKRMERSKNNVEWYIWRSGRLEDAEKVPPNWTYIKLEMNINWTSHSCPIFFVCFVSRCLKWVTGSILVPTKGVLSHNLFAVSMNGETVEGTCPLNAQCWDHVNTMSCYAISWQGMERTLGQWSFKV